MVRLDYRQTEIGEIPTDWDVIELHTVALDLYQGINTAIDKPEYVYSGIPILKANNIIDQKVSLEGVDQISKKSFESYGDRYKLKKNDFLFSNIGARLGTGSLLENDIECTFAWNVMRIVPNTQKIVPKYLSSIINSPKISQGIRDNQSGSGMGFVPKSVMGKVRFPCPKLLSEQKDIAKALSDIDDLIASLEKLIAKKRDIKTATMQQLLTGKKRLAGFGEGKGYKQTELGEIPEDWDVKTYGNIFSFYTTASNSRDDLDEDGLISYIHYGDIHTKWDITLDISKHNLPKIDRDKFKGAAFIKDGDVIMADASEDYEGIGKSIEVNGLGKEKAIAGLHTFLLRDNECKYADGFRGYLHMIPAVKKSFDRLATGLKVYGLSKNSLKTIFIPVPPKKEQEKIVKILLDMTEEINSVSRQLEKTKAIKQGMMQELLTGKTRLIGLNEIAVEEERLHGT